MGNKEHIDIESIRLALRVLAHFDKIDLENVELHENGIPLHYAGDKIQILDNFKFTGLSNRSFVDMQFWLEPLIDSSFF